MTNASRYCHRELFNRKSADYTHAARKQSFHAKTKPPLHSNNSVSRSTAKTAAAIRNSRRSGKKATRNADSLFGDPWAHEGRSLAAQLAVGHCASCHGPSASHSSRDTLEGRKAEPVQQTSPRALLVPYPSPRQCVSRYPPN